MKKLHHLLAVFCLAASTLAAADTVYLFTYFIKNGEDGLHLAWSEDGYQWQPLNEGRSYLAPKIGSKEKLMRDPCVTRGPDGTYHMVWTSGWWEKGIGYASTKDFITWSEQKEIPVMAHEPGARNSWAPEIVYDDTKGEFIVFWATTIPGRFPSIPAAPRTISIIGCIVPRRRISRPSRRQSCSTIRDSTALTRRSCRRTASCGL